MADALFGALRLNLECRLRLGSGALVDEVGKMRDEARDQRILFLLKLWLHLTETNLVWPKVRIWVERRLNEELGD